MAESQKAVLECEVANPDSQGQWMKDAKPLPVTDHFKTESDGVKRRLNIPISKLDDMGEYTFQVASSKTSAKLKVEGEQLAKNYIKLDIPVSCRVAGATGSILGFYLICTKVTRLKVPAFVTYTIFSLACSFETAVKIKKTLKNLTVTETQDAVFSVELTHPDVKGAQWIKNGVELQSNDKYEIKVEGTIHTLKVKNCAAIDESVYSFKLGKIGANARLHVESKSASINNLPLDLCTAF